MVVLVETVKVAHPTLGAVIINREDFNPEVHTLVVEEPPAAPVPETQQETPPVTAEEIEARKANDVYSATVDYITERVQECPSPAQLEELRAIELQNPAYPGGRAGVLKAIDKQLAVIARQEEAP